jgi:hypothetical protein
VKEPADGTAVLSQTVTAALNQTVTAALSETIQTLDHVEFMGMAY